MKVQKSFSATSKKRHYEYLVLSDGKNTVMVCTDYKPMFNSYPYSSIIKTSGVCLDSEPVDSLFRRSFNSYKYDSRFEVREIL